MLGIVDDCGGTCSNTRIPDVMMSLLFNGIARIDVK